VIGNTNWSCKNNHYIILTTAELTTILKSLL